MGTGVRYQTADYAVSAFFYDAWVNSRMSLTMVSGSASGITRKRLTNIILGEHSPASLGELDAFLRGISGPPLGNALEVISEAVSLYLMDRPRQRGQYAAARPGVVGRVADGLARLAVYGDRPVLAPGPVEPAWEEGVNIRFLEFPPAPEESL